MGQTLQDKELSTKFENRVFDFFMAEPFFAQRTSDDLEPDILCPNLCYIECTAIRKGQYDDNTVATNELMPYMHMIPESTINTINSFAGTRLGSGLLDKQEQLLRHIVGKKIDASLPRIVCLTVDLNDFSKEYKHVDLWEDVIYRYLYQVDYNAVKVTDVRILIVRNEGPIEKSNNTAAKIPTGIFQNKSHCAISGLLFVSPRILRSCNKSINYACDVLRSNETIHLIASDFCLYLNSFADVPIGYELAKSFFDVDVPIVRYLPNKSSVEKIVRKN